MNETVQSPTRTAILPEEEWHARRAAHESRVRDWTQPRVERRSRGEKHPVLDFLFEYYRFRPGALRRWHPGPDVALLGESAREFLVSPHYRETGGGVAVDCSTFDPQRRDTLSWLRGLLQATRDRAPQFSCYGLHEWAMVYRLPADEIRHSSWPLRLNPDETARVVESLPVRCSHFDAFRFFTPEARPLNRLQPERATAPAFEQRGCLHANMDLYKWAFKLAPFTPAELTADCFALAMEIRAVDMRASPYDLTPLRYAPIRVETPEGRAEYESHQRDFAARSVPLRERLLALCERLLAG